MNIQSRSYLFPIALAALLQLTASAATNAAAPEEKIGVTDTEITMVSCAPLSGQMKERGGQVVSGGRAYFNYINEQGGVNGRKIKLISCDDAYDPNQAITCFNQNIKGKAFIGTLFQGTAAAAKYVQMSDVIGLPLVGISAGTDFVTDPVHAAVFQVRASLHTEANEQVRALTHDLKCKRIAVIYQSDAYGAACRRDVLSAMKTDGATPVAEAAVARLTENVEPIIAEMKTAKPDAIILGVSGDVLPELIQRLHHELPHVRLVGFSVGSDLILKKAGAAADGVLITQVMPFTRKALPTVKLYESLIRKNEHQEPNISSFEGFVIAMTVVDGLKAAGKDLTRTGFVRAMESLKNVDMGLGPTFKLSYSHTNHEGLSGGVYWTRINKGALEDVSSLK